MEPRLIPGFLASEECALLVHLAEQKGMSSSKVVREEADVSTERRSKTAWLAADDHPFMGVLFRRAREVTGVDPRWFEELQVVRYEAGGYFRPHYDQCFQKSEGCATETRRFGGRLRRYTLLIYLASPEQYDGGETRFPRLRRSFRGARGDALLFENLHEDSLHEGAPITRGTKWVCNLWMRPP